MSPRRPRRWCGGGGRAGGGGGRSRPPRGAPRSAEAARRPKGKRRSRGTYELWRILDDAWTQMRNDPGETRAEQKLSAKHKKRSRIAEASRSTDHDNVQEPNLYTPESFPHDSRSCWLSQPSGYTAPPLVSNKAAVSCRTPAILAVVV